MTSRKTGLYRPKYRGKNGKVHTSETWWIDYSCSGCIEHPHSGRHRESTNETKITRAKKVLDSKRGAAANGQPLLNINEIPFTDLLESVELDYKIRRKLTSQLDLRDKLKKHIRPFFAKYRAIELCLDEKIIQRFIALKKSEKYSASSINGMLAVISRAFSLAKNRFPLRPSLEKLEVDNARKVFFTESEFHTLCVHLPDDVRRVVQAAWHLGWRGQI